MIENPILLDDSQKALLADSIYDAGRQVSVGDVVSRTGLPAAAVAIALREFAFQSRAHILVDQNGSVAYRFKVGFDRKKNFAALEILSLLVVATRNLCLFVIKTGFGLALVLSSWSFALPLLIFAVTKSLYDFVHLKDQANEQWWVFDAKNWPQLFGALTNTKIDHAGLQIPSNFFLDCFSFVFGDGEPNPDKLERQWRLVAHVIESNKGGVVCEQLAPIFGRKNCSEDDMIPVMARFDGTPAVTSTGHLVYIFPKISAINSIPSESDAVSSCQTPEFFEERYWRLSGISKNSKELISVIILVNAITWLAMLTVGLQVKDIAAWSTALGLWFVAHHFGFICAAALAIFHLFGLWAMFWGILSILIIIPTLLLFSFFIAFYPLGRFVINQLRNIPIWMRNKERENCAVMLSKPSEDLLLKLEEAKKFSQRVIPFDQDNLVFDSSKDSIESQF